MFSDVAYGEFVQTGSRINVEDRQTVIVATTAVAAASAVRVRPAPPTPTVSGPTSGPSPRSGRRMRND